LSKNVIQLHGLQIRIFLQFSPLFIRGATPVSLRPCLNPFKGKCLEIYFENCADALFAKLSEV